MQNIAWRTAPHNAVHQTAICATSSSTNAYVAVRTLRQKRVGLRQQQSCHIGRRPITIQRAFGESSGSSKDPSLQDYVEVKIESVKVNGGVQTLPVLYLVHLNVYILHASAFGGVPEAAVVG